MDREGFRNRLKQYKKAREENPGLKYWEWKAIPKYGDGTHQVTKGESLSSIAKKYGLTLQDIIDYNPQIKNPNIINIGQSVNILDAPIQVKTDWVDYRKLREKEKAIADSTTTFNYEIKQGDVLSRIAKDNGLTLSQLLMQNPQITDPNRVSVGQLLSITKTTDSNLEAIQSVSHRGNYVVVDKTNKKLTVYNKDNKPIYVTNNIATGASNDDYNTITYVDANGIIRNMQGNNSTPAGITEITGKGTYHGAPSFTRGRYNRRSKKFDEDIASSLHTGRIDIGSNGCVRLPKKELSELSDKIRRGTKVYTLPEQEGSRFVKKDNKLSFVADNPYGKTTGKKKYWDDYNTYVDTSYNPLMIAYAGNYDDLDDDFINNSIAFANALSVNKELLQKELSLDSATYNDLAELALGIAHQESKFGTSTRKKIKDTIPDFAINLLKAIRDGKSGARSVGMTQIKLDADNEQMQKFYEKHGINNETIVDSAELSAIATIGRLAHMYNNEVRGRTFVGANDVKIDPMDVILYKYMGRNKELQEHTATPKLNKYIQNVKKYAKEWDLFSEQQQFANGGIVPKYEKGDDNVLSNLQDDNQLKYKSSKVKYNTDPSTFTKNLYNRITPIPALMPDGPIIGGIKSYFNNSDTHVEETFSEDQLGTLDVEKFNEFKENIENVINRQGYAEAMEPFILEDSKDIYLDMPQRFNTYEISEFKPKGAENKTYYKNKFLEEAGAPLLLDVVKDIKTNTIVPHSYWMDYGRAYKITKNKNAVAVLPGYGNATVGNGIDSKKGEYVSYYDKWDVGRFSPNTKHPLDYFYDPVNVYGRVYLDDYYDINSAPNEGDYYGGYLPELSVTAEKYKDGGEVGDNKAIPTQEEYIAEQIAAKKATALSNFRSATEPVLPIINGQPNVNSCIYTALNMYGKQYAVPGNWTFYDNPNKYGFKQKELNSALPADLILVLDKGTPYHMMMLDGYDEKGLPLYNYSRGMKGDSSDIIKSKTNFPNTKKLAYEFVGTPADSVLWKNEYKKLYGYADGGEVGDNTDYRQQIINRADYVASNYDNAKDFDLNPLVYTFRKFAKDNFDRGGISNCTLSATGWIDPNNQYMSAKNIFNNPSSGYTEIDAGYALPGDLLITKNPEKNSYHTMLIEGFNGNEPILRYSRGGHDTKENLVTGRPLLEYHELDNKQGGNHTEDHYFRYNIPNEYWLPELIVTPNKR